MHYTIFNEEIDSFIKANSAGNNSVALAAIVNEHFGTSYSADQISCRRYRIGARSGIDTRLKKGDTRGFGSRFRPGDIPANKGKTWDEMGISEEARRNSLAHCFKKGHVPKNHRPVGSELIRADGYVWKKIAEPGVWKQKHILLWEDKNGKIPENMCLIFLDGDRSHISLDNLLLVSRKELRCLNNTWNNDRTADSQLTKANIGLRRLNTRITAIEKEGR